MVSSDWLVSWWSVGGQLVHSGGWYAMLVLILQRPDATRTPAGVFIWSLGCRDFMVPIPIY